MAKAGVYDQAAIVRLRGIGYQLQKDYPAAIAVYQQALELSRSLALESDDVTRSLNNLANAEMEAGDYVAAKRDYQEALRIAKKLDNAEGIAIYIGNLANLALGRQDWSTAEREAREALELAERLGRQELIGSNCRRLAKALARQARQAEGLPYARRAVEVFTQLQKPDELNATQTVLRECEQGV